MRWNHRYFVVGLTGGIGAGKSTVAALLLEEGVRVVSADALAHDALESPGIRKEMVRLFGEGALHPDGTVNRKAVAEIVFAREGKRQELNALIHPEVRRRFQEIRNTLHEGEILVYDVPLLFEAGLDGEFDLTVVVTAPEELRLQRVRQRNGWSEEEFRQRENSQLPLSEKERRAHRVLRNDSSLEELRHGIRELLKEIRQGRNEDRKP